MLESTSSIIEQETTPSTHYSLDRIRGMLVGLALGDALGAPHEFRYQRSIPYSGHLDKAPTLVSRWQGRCTFALGQVTDDTEMTLTLAHSLVAHGGYSQEKTLLAYLQWANSGGKAIGKNTRALLRGVKTLRGYQTRFAKETTKSQQEWTQSNGALMRCSPLALLFDNRPVIEDCSLTNPHPVCLDTNMVYVSCLRLALSGTSVERINEVARQTAQTSEVREVVMSALEGRERDIADKKGWCLHALWCALRVLNNFSSYQEAIDWIILHPGSDTDTNAAIAGALLGARLGWEELQKEERTEKNFEILLSCDTTKGEHPRPPEYTLHDFFSLTERLQALSRCS